MSTPVWMEDAACTTREARALPWTTDTIEVPEVIVDLMRSTCDSCAVRSACNSYALEERVSGGMWAGSDRAAEPRDLLELIDTLPKLVAA
ncbi:WhiB family transcriptional regulator [Nocardioides sp.]|uniref:WhiB family transcriptional regulator n=1 Tax=Nocardioides sp. TaxID=35761 RepID=UPI0019B70620|nr:WhiB family transcriptional regulator [Nocardioides sp.]MBC7275013.1 WhiB family transcriptional regulator [Nocardioides sp.]